MTNFKNYAFYLTDGTGNIISWTTAAEEMYGFPAEDIIGKHISVFHIKKNEEEKSALRDLLGKAQRTGRYTVTGWRQTSKGELFVEDTFTLLNSGKAEADSFLVTTKNVSKEKELDGLSNIHESIDRLRAVLAYRLNLREEENAVMAKKIHDELGQQITGLKMDVSWLDKKLQHEDEIIKKKLRTIKEMLDDTVKIVRKISADLRPGILDDFGLIDALEWYSGEFEKMTGIKVTFSTEEWGINFDKNRTTHLFRIYQESLNGALNCTDTSLIISNIRIKNQVLEWTIFCDGKEMKNKDKSLLVIMDLQERMLGINGNYHLLKNPGKGITAYISIPLKSL